MFDVEQYPGSQQRTQLDNCLINVVSIVLSGYWTLDLSDKSWVFNVCPLYGLGDLRVKVSDRLGEDDRPLPPIVQ
jgi:hypothetical protein